MRSLLLTVCLLPALAICDPIQIPDISAFNQQALSINQIPNTVVTNNYSAPVGNPVITTNPNNYASMTPTYTYAAPQPAYPSAPAATNTVNSTPAQSANSNATTQNNAAPSYAGGILLNNQSATGTQQNTNSNSNAFFLNS